MQVPTCRFKFNSMWPVTAWGWRQGISGARIVNGWGLSRLCRWIPPKAGTLCEPGHGDDMPQLLPWGGVGCTPEYGFIQALSEGLLSMTVQNGRTSPTSLSLSICLLLQEAGSTTQFYT